MNPRRLQRETIFSMSSAVLASAIRGKSVLKGSWDVKEAADGTEGNKGNEEIGVRQRLQFKGKARLMTRKYE